MFNKISVHKVVDEAHTAAGRDWRCLKRALAASRWLHRNTQIKLHFIEPCQVCAQLLTIRRRRINDFFGIVSKA